MTLRWTQLIIDSKDPDTLGRWWPEALGWVVLGDPEGNEFCILSAADVPDSGQGLP